jgi:hypothetical protein
MENIRIEATDNTPFVNFDATKGFIELSGRSIPEDASAFFFPLIDWLSGYNQNPKDKTVFHFYLEYINSISQKMLIDIFLKACELKNAGHNLEIVWFYDEEDEEMHDEGSVFRNKLNLPIELKIKK